MQAKKMLASVIDAAVLNANATELDIVKACAEAKTYQFYGLDVNLAFAPLAKRLLKNTKTKLIVVVGYPLGATSTETKMFETLQAIKAGADEIDMAMNIGKFKSHHYEDVKKDISAVVEAAQGRTVKVIIETGLLNHEEIENASTIVVASGAQFVKTCTGYGPRGVSLTDVKIIRKTVGQDFGIKASGGINTAKHALALINAGATRIGTSHGKKVMTTIPQTEHLETAIKEDLRYALDDKN
ncbi:deoxyribose-phosphate aldolase [Candidatus Woesearchaeota archaeon]|nr:deoxyribose-phosphate aldolase [Candidatus Woesearchaeota archaeon]